MDQHIYSLQLDWTGNKGKGTSAYAAYSRDHDIIIDQKPVLHCSSDPLFRGDQLKHNPEDFLLAAVASCHMLWYLHLCADQNVVVISYQDNPKGILSLHDNGSGQFTCITLYPKVHITTESDIQLAISLHKAASMYCFIANSLNIEVCHSPEIFKGDT
ncbi:MAG: OsmC family protein [Saprospiraceae bacterium]